MTEVWQPLSVRQGKREADGPYEGMPPHLRHPVREWMRGQFGWFRQEGVRHHLMAEVASALRIPVQPTHAVGGISDQIFAAIERDESLYLDCVDATLFASRGGGASTLAAALKTGASVWTVREDQRGLERRVPEATTEAYGRAVAVGDVVADELRQAWGAVFGRHPDPSDAWDHAIKAVEDLLIPIVVPKASKPNLGTVAGEIKAHPEMWIFGVPANGTRTNGETLEGLLRHIWPNPDRHGGAGKRAPTQAEAEAAVQVAILVVGLCGGGRLVKAP